MRGRHNSTQAKRAPAGATLSATAYTRNAGRKQTRISHPPGEKRPQRVEKAHVPTRGRSAPRNQVNVREIYHGGDK